MSTDYPIPIRRTSPLKQLSHSGVQTLHTCPRKFELDRIGSLTVGSAQGIKRVETVHTGYGSAFGAGLAALLSGEGLDRAIFECILNYRFDYIYPDSYSPTKSLFHCINALKRFNEKELAEISTDWKVLELDGKPAKEVGFAIQLPNGFFYRGFIDLVMQHRLTKTIMVIEVKTTGKYPSLNDELNESTYKYSPQGTAYALVADWLAKKLNVANDISVAYLVHYTKNNTFEPRIFPKHPEIRIRFLEDLIVELDFVSYLLERNKPFPMYGNCSNYSSVCQYYGICGIDKYDFTQIEDSDIGEFDLIIPFKELLELQYARIESINQQVQLL